MRVKGKNLFDVIALFVREEYTRTLWNILKQTNNNNNHLNFF